MTLFDWLKELTGKKRDWDSFSDKERESFNPYMVNRFLSMHKPFIELAKEEVILLDNDILEDILYRHGYQPDQVLKMFK